MVGGWAGFQAQVSRLNICMVLDQPQRTPTMKCGRCLGQGLEDILVVLRGAQVHPTLLS